MENNNNTIGLPHQLGKPAQRVLVQAGYTQLEQLTAISEKELSSFHGIGPKAIQQLKLALKENGLSLMDSQ